MFEIIFMIFGRIYGTDVIVLLVSIVSGVLFAPLFYSAGSRLNEPLPTEKKTLKLIQSISYPVLFFLIHITVYIATVSFVTGVENISGASFGPIADLSAPDSLIKTASFSVNLLPFIFLILSGLSVFIDKTKMLTHRIVYVVLYLILTVLLYFSPAGVNIFWIAYATIGLLVSVLAQVLSKANNGKNANRQAGKGNPGAENIEQKKPVPKPDLFLFLTGIIYLIILTGIFIPTNIMKVSAAEFVDVLDVKNPLHYIFYSSAYAFGTFGIWCGVYYYLAKNNIRIVLDRLVWIVSVIAFINLILAGSYLGETSTGLFYFEYREFSFIQILIDIVLSIVAGILVLLLIGKKKDFMRILVVAELGMLLFSSVSNCIKINSVYSGLRYINAEKDSENIITLNKKGHNVIVIIIDRALGTEIPYIFNEKPELKVKFDGFTWYPNTISFGGYTNTGIPSVYGGYEYTPDKINARSNETLEEKHNEALKVMPVLFNQNGYNVTVCDPVYAGYNWIPDLSIFDEYENIKAYNTDGKFDKFAPDDYIGPREQLKRNFFIHSLMKIAPFNWQFLLYNEGHYCNPNTYLTFTNRSIYQSEGYDYDFLDAYLVLENLCNITKINDNENNNLLLFYNGTPHMPCLLQEPDYTPSRIVDNREYHQNDTERFNINGISLPMESSLQLTCYSVHMATYLQLGKYFDYLKDNDCYDNSRIVIVSDHGRNVHFLEEIGDSKIESEYFMPVLMVKDFDSHGFNVSDEFMTNADVNALATSGLIDNPINPFTGNPLNSDAKNAERLTVFYSDKCNLEDNHGNTFVPGKWFTVHDNPHEINNWEYLGEY